MVRHSLAALSAAFGDFDLLDLAVVLGAVQKDFARVNFEVAVVGG